MNDINKNKLIKMEIVYNESTSPSLFPTTYQSGYLLPTTRGDNRNMIWMTFQITFITIFIFFMMILITYITHQLNITREMRRLRERVSTNVDH